MKTESICATRDGAVLRLCLNRPQRRNALNSAMLHDLRGRLEACGADHRIRVIILNAVGTTFCAGQDLAERDPRGRETSFDLEKAQKTLYHPIIKLLQQIPQPVLVAVNGVAAGAGAALALSGDIVLAAHSAQFVMSFIRIGLSVDAGLGHILVSRLGAARSCGLLMTGGTISATEAAAHGLIWRCVEDHKLDCEINELAAQLAASPRIALSAIKHALVAAQQSADYLNIEAALQGEAGRSADYREGVTAFLERRAPRFSPS